MNGTNTAALTGLIEPRHYTIKVRIHIHLFYRTHNAR